MSKQPFQVGYVVERIEPSPEGRQSIGDRKVIQEVRGLPRSSGQRRWLLKFDDDTAMYSRAEDFKIAETEPEASAHG